MSDFTSNWGNVTKILQMLQAVYSSDVCEFLKDHLCNRCHASSWNKEYVTHVQEVVCSVVADGTDDCRKDQNFDW
jgi:hypothetical protein